MRALLAAMMCFAALPAHASVFDEVSKAILDTDMKQVKPQYRECSTDSDCVAVMSMCRWRPVSRASEKYIADMSAQVQLECKWPPPPANAPGVRCIGKLCVIPPDGAYY